jgi:hypothetical protein
MRQYGREWQMMYQSVLAPMPLGGHLGLPIWRVGH